MSVAWQKGLAKSAGGILLVRSDTMRPIHWTELTSALVDFLQFLLLDHQTVDLLQGPSVAKA